MSDQSTDRIDRLIDENVDFAREQMRREGGLHPMYAFKIGRTTLPLVAEFEDEDAKMRVLNQARTVVVAFWPQSVAFMMECWISQKFDDQNNPLYARASQDPDRKEGVLVLVATPGVERGRALLTKRDAQDNVVDLVASDMPASDMGGQLSGLYPERAPTRQVQRQAQRSLEPYLGKDAIQELRQYAGTPTSTATH